MNNKEKPSLTKPITPKSAMDIKRGSDNDNFLLIKDGSGLCSPNDRYNKAKKGN
jgi:hypothetical protein